MPIIASEGEKKEFILTPAANHQAVCYDIWDVGFQKSKFNGEEKIQHKVYVAWEINETIPTGQYIGKRFTISKRYTLSLHEKANLRKDLESWRGRKFTEEELKAFDLEKLIGANCMLNVVHSEDGDKKYSNVAAVTAMPKGLPKIEEENGRGIPEWIKKKQSEGVDPNVGAEGDLESGPLTAEEESIPF